MRNRYFVAALATLGLSAAMAQEATPDTWTHASSFQSRADLVQAVAAARANGDLDPLHQYEVVDRHYKSTLSRAEVLADLQLWQRAGMTQFSRGEAGPNVYSAEYRRAYARYAEMRASPEFPALVQSIAQRGGEAVIFARPGKFAR